MPDAEAQCAASEILKVVTASADSDLVIALVSGGGSALLPFPANGITLNEKRNVRCYYCKCNFSKLMICSNCASKYNCVQCQVIESMGKEGASIQELNIVRQLISKTKGGKLSAAAAPTKVPVCANAYH